MSEPAPPPPSPAPSPAPSRGEPPRIRFVALRVSRAPSGRCRAEVELQAIDGRTLGGAADVQPTVEGDLRAAAAATLDALHQASETGPRFTLFGVKNVRAFDQHVILVQLGADRFGATRTEGERPVRLMGSAFADADLMRAAVLAVLNASNRVLWGAGGG
jgi:hypothetical protein